MKKLLVTSLIFVVIVAVSIFLVKNTRPDILTIIPQPIGMCYTYSKETARGYVDRALLQMNIVGTTVTGEYRNLPAEKDSKVGTFTGTVGAMDPKISARIADVWWNSFAEGMRVTEQLNIEFGEGSAVALFGEMVDRGDGTYVYKDIAELTPGFYMSQTDCELVQDIIIVEQYVRDNLKTIVPEKAVLGGSWHATMVYINPSTKSGTLAYEDGHIQGRVIFTYLRNGDKIHINNVKKPSTSSTVADKQTCYAYHHTATVDAPYTVDEYIDLKINGTKITGIKHGTQNGPDLTNGYSGTLNGSFNDNLITAVFSYTVEGSQNKEKELYTIATDGLQKLRYPLLEQKGILIPDTTKEFNIMQYSTVDCSLI